MNPDRNFARDYETCPEWIFDRWIGVTLKVGEKKWTSTKGHQFIPLHWKESKLGTLWISTKSPAFISTGTKFNSSSEGGGWVWRNFITVSPDDSSVVLSKKDVISLVRCDPGSNHRQPFSIVAFSSGVQSPSKFPVVIRNVPSVWGLTAPPTFALLKMYMLWQIHGLTNPRLLETKQLSSRILYFETESAQNNKKFSQKFGLRRLFRGSLRR